MLTMVVTLHPPHWARDLDNLRLIEATAVSGLDNSIASFHVFPVAIVAPCTMPLSLFVNLVL